MDLPTAYAAWRKADAAFVISVPLDADHVSKCAAFLAAENDLHEACVALGMHPGGSSEQFARRALSVAGRD